MFVIIYFGQIELKFLEADGGSYCAEIFVNFTLVGGALPALRLLLIVYCRWRLGVRGSMMGRCGSSHMVSMCSECFWDDMWCNMAWRLHLLFWAFWHWSIAVNERAAGIRWLMMKLDTQVLGHALWCSKELGYIRVLNENGGRSFDEKWFLCMSRDVWLLWEWRLWLLLVRDR